MSIKRLMFVLMCTTIQLLFAADNKSAGRGNRVDDNYQEIEVKKALRIQKVRAAFDAGNNTDSEDDRDDGEDNSVLKKHRSGQAETRSLSGSSNEEEAEESSSDEGNALQQSLSKKQLDELKNANKRGLEIEVSASSGDDTGDDADTDQNR